MPEPEERYVTVDLAVLEAIKELAWLQQVNWTALPAIRLVLRIARIDPVTGNLVIAVTAARDLDDPDQQ
jgi:hypothetical protein